MKQKLQSSVYENLKEQTKLEIEFLSGQIEKYEALLLLEEESEPSKLFKTSYQTWKENKRELEFQKKKYEEELEIALEDLKRYENMV